MVRIPFTPQTLAGILRFGQVSVAGVNPAQLAMTLVSVFAGRISWRSTPNHVLVAVFVIVTVKTIGSPTSNQVLAVADVVFATLSTAFPHILPVAVAVTTGFPAAAGLPLSVQSLTVAVFVNDAR